MSNVRFCQDLGFRLPLRSGKLADAVLSILIDFFPEKIPPLLLAGRLPFP